MGGASLGARRWLIFGTKYNVCGQFIVLTAGMLGSGLVDQSQKMAVAASAMAEKKTVGQRS